MASSAFNKGIELVNSVPFDIPTRLRGDPGRLRQILTNLIGNAIKFTKEGEVVLSVSKESESATDIAVEVSKFLTPVSAYRRRRKHDYSRLLIRLMILPPENMVGAV